MIHLVRLDETMYWDAEFRRELGTGRIYGIYAFDDARQVHCCEVTPSYELAYICSETEHCLADDDDERFCEAWMMGAELTHYYHCRHINALRDSWVEWDSESIDDAIESYQANPHYWGSAVVA